MTLKKSLPYVLSAFVILPPLLVQAQPTPPPPPEPPERPHIERRVHHRFRTGIPPHIAAKLGISDELQKKIQQLTFDANEQLINLQADAKRQQLELQKLLAQDRPNQGAVMSQVDRIARAEAEVRKNRLGLMLKIRETLGPDLWKKVEAEMPIQKRIMKRKFKHRERGALGGPEDIEFEMRAGFDGDIDEHIVIQ